MMSSRILPVFIGLDAFMSILHTANGCMFLWLLRNLYSLRNDLNVIRLSPE